MVISVQVYVQHPDLALAPTIRSAPEADISVLSDAGTDPHHDVYFYVVSAADFGVVEAALTADHTVADWSVIVERESRRTYRIEYSDEATLVSPAVAEVGGLTIESRSHATGWLLELQLPGHEALTELREYADAAGVRFQVRELRQDSVVETEPDFGLTESQAEALIAAFVNGYYDEPRETSLEELAELLGISKTAVSGRLKRGSARLVEAMLIEEDEE